MATTTLSSKNQITLPVEVVRALGLKAGDKLDIELIDDRIIVWPKPQSYADYFIGSLRGAWGGTATQIDRYVAEERASWGADGHTEEEATDFLTGPGTVNEAARQIVNGLRARRFQRAFHPEVINMVEREKGRGEPETWEAIRTLVQLGVVRQIGQPQTPDTYDNVEYRLLKEIQGIP